MLLELDETEGTALTTSLWLTDVYGLSSFVIRAS